MRPRHRFTRCVTPLTLLQTAPLLIASWLAPAPAHAQEVGRTVIPVGSQWPGARPGQVAISGDGRYVVYQANRGDGWKLFLHERGQSASREIPGLGDVPYFPLISPNGQWLLFGKKGWIWKAPLAGGPLSLVYTANLSKMWETGETLVVRKSTGIWRLQADGSGREELVAPLDTASGATGYGRPSMLPGGKGVLVSVGFNTGLDLRRIGVVSLPGGKLTLLDEYGINPRYSESGHILYTQGSTLKAIPFDLERLVTVGPAATVVEGVHVYSNQASQFDISRNGVLVYVPGPSELGRVWPRTLAWVDREGRETAFDTPAEKFFGVVRLSPDKRYLAAEVGAGLYLFDRQSGTWSVLSAGGNSGAPMWAGGSETLFYSKAGVLGRQSVEAGSAWEELWKGDTQFWGFSLAADASQALGTAWIPESGLWRLMSVSLEGTPRAGALLERSDNVRRNPAISPDGKWLAYVEKVDGLDRVLVQPFPAGGRPLLVSQGAAGEAAEPVWGRNSEELFYRDAAHMVAVQLETEPALRVRKVTPLFPIRRYYQYLNTFATVHDYDPGTDRFLMTRWAIPDLSGTDLQVIENAFDLLNRLAPRR